MSRSYNTNEGKEECLYGAGGKARGEEAARKTKM
jgi:hypothetical protein